MYDYYLHFTWILTFLTSSFIFPTFIHSIHMRQAQIIHSFIQQTYPKHHAYNFVQSKPLWFQEVLLSVQMHCPCGLYAVLRPHIQCWVPRVSTPSTRLPCCDNHLIPIVSNHLPSFSSPADYAPTPFQTPKLRFAHNCSDNSPRIRGWNGVHLNELHNCSLKCFSSAAILWDSTQQFIFHIPSPHQGCRLHSPSLRHWERVLCFSGAPIHHGHSVHLPFSEWRSTQTTQKASWLEKHRMTATGSFKRLVCFSYPKTSWKSLKLNSPFLIS